MKNVNPKNIDHSRRGFIKKSVAGLAGAAALPSVLVSQEKKSTFVYRTLGKTGIKLPIVSMGVMNADNPNLVKAALDAGIVHLDTAHVYQRGRNEEMIGQVIKGRKRDSFVLGTKVVPENRDRKTGLFTAETKAGPFIENFETSLKRLQVDYVDILYMHNVSRREAALFEPIMAAMQQLKKQGKARFIGVSTHRNEPEVIQAVIDSKVYDVVLTAYNFRQPHRDEVKAAIGRAASAGIGVVAMKTQAGVYWDRERQHPINMKAALKWVLLDKNVSTAIPGFTAFDQMDLDLSVMEDLTLTPQEKKDLQPREESTLAGLYCQQCGKCVAQCRRHIDIPTLMRSYMYAYGYRNLGVARQTLDSLEPSPIGCRDCRTCVVRCTMGFDVRQRVLDIARLKDVPEEFLA
jgi:predicted aldo/keto reductase-like oxidoreductase